MGSIEVEVISKNLNHTSLSNGHSKPVPSSRASKYLPVANPGASFWHSEPHKLHDHRSTEKLPEYSDIVIIGAGFAGVSTAYHLVNDQNTSKSITVLEARGVCSGATGRNGGHLRPDFYGHIPDYIDRAGIEAAAEIAQFEIANLQAIKKIVEQEQIDCDLTLTRTIDVWCNEKSAQGAKRVYDEMVSRGLDYMKDAIFYTGKNVEGICGVKGAVACASYTAGTIWPYKFIMHLVESLMENGRVNFQTHTPATLVIPNPNGGVVIETPRGRIHAEAVIYANNGYSAGLLPEYEKNIIPCKGICCHISVPEGKMAPLLNDSYINRTNDGTLSYLIPRPDGSIVVGGASSTFKPFKEQWYNIVDDSILIDSAKDYYTDYMQTTYRGWENSGAKIDHIWTGVMGYSYDSHPHIGSVPAKDDQYILAGFNGHGMPVIWLAAKELAKMAALNIPFEGTSLPRLFKTTQRRIDKARNGREEDGDILRSEYSPTQQ